MPKTIKIKTIAAYKGHNVKNNKSVDITFTFGYEELERYILLIQFLNENVKVVIKKSEEPAVELGIFMIKSINVTHDGEGEVRMNSMTDQSEVQVMHSLAGSEPFKIMFEAEVEPEGEEE